MLVSLTLVLISGCKKSEPVKTTAPPEAPKPAPTVSISVSPNSVERGQSANIRWSSTNADNVNIDGIGYVNPSGTQSVTPADSTTYRITAKGAGGSATDSARLTVTSAPVVETPKPVVTKSNNETDEQWFARNVKDIFFDYDAFNIRDNAKSIVTSNAAALIQKNWNFVIEGHCDERGSTEYNLTLGDERATAARDALIAAGVPANRISIISYGKEKPACSDATEECWQRNRRAHIVLKK